MSRVEPLDLDWLFKQASRPRGTEKLGSILGQIMGMASQGVAGETWTQLQPWATAMVQQAMLRWSAVIASGARCGVGRCEHAAVGFCEACGGPACLHHARPNFSAALVCERCVFEKIRDSRFTRAANGADRPPSSRRGQRAKRRPMDEQTAAALLVFGLPASASWEQINARFRELATTLHPDKHPEGPRRLKAQERFARVSAAYAVLKERRAA